MNSVSQASCDYCQCDLELTQIDADKRRLSHNRFVCDSCRRVLLRDPMSDKICMVQGCTRHRYDGSEFCYLCINEIYERQHNEDSGDITGIE